jgi:hypothetical protein
MGSARSFGNRCLFEGVVVVLDRFAHTVFESCPPQAGAAPRELSGAERLAARRERFFPSQMHASAGKLGCGSASSQRAAASKPSPEVSP